VASLRLAIHILIPRSLGNSNGGTPSFGSPNGGDSPSFGNSQIMKDVPNFGQNSSFGTSNGGTPPFGHP
jgi:hypothetical protein